MLFIWKLKKFHEEVVFLDPKLLLQISFLTTAHIIKVPFFKVYQKSFVWVYLCFKESEDGGTEGATHIPLFGCRVVKEADLQGDQPFRAQVDPLDLLMSRPTPHIQTMAIVTCMYMAKW